MSMEPNSIIAPLLVKGISVAFKNDAICGRNYIIIANFWRKIHDQSGANRDSGSSLSSLSYIDRERKVTRSAMGYSKVR